MEVLLMVVILHALCLHQGLQGAVISSNENRTNTSRSDEFVKKQSTEGGPHTRSLSGDCSGSLVALYHGRWVAVTLRQQSNETKKDAAQLCKDLGCGGAFAHNDSVFMNTCLSDCTIIHSNLQSCTGAPPDNCSNVTEVVCAWQAVQLTGGKDRCAGRVELFGGEGWGSVCDDGWDMKAGDVVCAQLGCGTALWVTGKSGVFDLGSGPIHISQLNCNGTESNLWQCATELDEGRNFCGHKEDAAVICSESFYIPTTTINTFMTDLTNWTTETVAAAVDSSGGISAPVLGCIVLSVALLLLLFLNAAQCAYYKRQNGGTGARRASHRDHSDTLHYFHPESPSLTAVNHCEYSDISRAGNCNQTQERFREERNAEQIIDQFYPEHCIQMTPLHKSSEPAKKGSVDLFDSDSTSSGECYKNTEMNAEPCLQTLEGNPSLHEQTLLSHTIPQTAENSVVSQQHFLDQAQAVDSESTSSGECYENTGLKTENLLNPGINQFYPKHCTQITPLANTSEPAQCDAVDSFDSDSTSSGECYENIGVNPEPCLQTLEANPSLPEQPLLSHTIPQMAGNSSVSQPYCPDQDSSTSSEDAYENVPEVEENCFARGNHSVHSSSDSDYDDICNW